MFNIRLLKRLLFIGETKDEHYDPTWIKEWNFRHQEAIQYENDAHGGSQMKSSDPVSWIRTMKFWINFILK